MGCKKSDDDNPAGSSNTNPVMTMKQYKRWLAGLGAALTVGAIALPQVNAVELADGSIAFVQPPSLAYSGTTQNQAAASQVTYYFTIQVPDAAGEPLQKLSIAQQDGRTSLRRVRYDLEDTEAFVGTRRDRGEALPVSATYDDENQVLDVTFNPPVPPGTVVTLAARPDRNPRADGVYLFGVTAFPQGETVREQFLGYARFHIYSNGDSIPINNFWR
jgi:hypothetical protein